MDLLKAYRLRCTLTFGDIYGQIIVWLMVIFASLAAALASVAGSSQPVFAMATVALILVVTLPFLLFAFVTTLFNHIEAVPIDAAEAQSNSPRASTAGSSSVSAGAMG